MADPSEVGKYGTIRLLKHREPCAVVAVYPIDDEHVSFGRDASCSVRLYYPEVSPLHCMIVFEERKAILQVLGGSGVIVDGCPVYPTKPAVLGSPPATVTVPLPNGSIFEIHKKRFMFNYPPKALRPQLFTPATVRRKSIRMSLVQSAQVFSPAPSPHPRENLRILQSPLRLPSSESPVKLVDGDHPRVYEEGQDLVILEDVEPQPNGYVVGSMMSPAPMRLQTLPAVPQGPPRTPRRRSIPSLHRAVLIRSAQRTAYMRESQAQMERAGHDHNPQYEQYNPEDEDAEGEEDDEDEEDEVINSILAPDETEADMENEEHSAEDMAIDAEENDGEIAQIGQQDITEAFDECNEDGTNEPRLTTPLQVSRALHLGGFSTPQPGLFSRRSEQNRNERRKTGPQRPPPGFRFSLAPGFERGSMVIKEEEMDEDGPSVPIRSTSPTKRQEITEEERKAILERRRSALKEPDPEIGKSVFGPGEKGASTIPPPALAPASPFKTLSTHIEEGEDTQVVLQRMQVQVAERRASLSPTRPRISRGIGRGMLPPSPEKTFSLLASKPRLGSSMRAMPKLEEGLEERQSEFENHESMDIDDGTHTSKNRIDEENDENTSPTRERSRTPRLDGLREMFRAPAAAIGLATPAVRGVRDLFRAPAIPQTPRMEGMRQLFAQQRALETPALDGIKDMMHVDDQDQVVDSERAETSEERNTPDVPEDVNDKPEVTGTQPSARTRKLPLATRTLSRTKGARPTLFRSRGTPTDTSTMADDEATPDSAPVDDSRRLDASEGVPEAAVVHRTGRGRRGARAGSDTEGSKTTLNKQTALKSGEESGRQVEGQAEGMESEQGDRAPSVKPPSKSRGGRKADSAATASESEAGGDSTAQSSSRGTRAGSAQTEGGATRRSTRARSRSAEPDNDDNAKRVTKAGTQAVAAAVETIPEEEEPVSTQAKTSRASAPSASKTRRTRTRTESSADDAPPPKRVGRTTSSAAATRRTGKASAVESTEDAPHVEDKENTPEHSPISETADDASSEPGKPASKARVGAKPPSKKKAGLGSAGGTKAASRTTKAKTAEGSSSAPRATRTRARK